MSLEMCLAFKLRSSPIIWKIGYTFPLFLNQNSVYFRWSKLLFSIYICNSYGNSKQWFKQCTSSLFDHSDIIHHSDIHHSFHLWYLNQYPLTLHWHRCSIGTQTYSFSQHIFKHAATCCNYHKHWAHQMLLRIAIQGKMYQR